jgi:RND superfamily putative drug exporter
MASRFARAVVRHPWVVIIAWILVVGLASRRAPHVIEALTAKGESPQATESARADALLHTRFSRPLDNVFVVTLAAPAPLDSGHPGEVLDSLAATLGRLPYVQSVTSWRSADDSSFISRDRKTALLFVALSVSDGAGALALVAPFRALVRGRLVQLGVDTLEYQAHVTGESPLEADLRTVSESDSRRGEIRLAPLTLAVLVLAFGALVAAMLPLIVGFIAIWVALALIAVIATATPMSVFVMNITTMLGLGVGIDYSLLVITRFREELGMGGDARGAAIRATETAGMAALTSGLTVLVGFGALLLTPLVETRSLGIGGLVVVGVAMALSVTLLPALLAVLGHAIDRPRWLARRLAWYHTGTFWRRWAERVSARPVPALFVGALVIGLLSWPMTLMRIGLPARHWWPSGTESARGVDALEQIGVGTVTQPIRALIELPPGQRAVSATALRGLQRLADSIRTNPRVRQVRSIANPGPVRSVLALSILYSDLAEARAAFPDFVDSYLSTDGRMALVDIVLQDSVSLTSGMQVAQDVRRMVQRGTKGLEGSRSVVGGFFASTLDLQDILLGRFPLLVAIIMLVTAVMLAIAFRSVLVPIKAVIMNSLSVAGSFGLIVLVFQQGWGSGLVGLSGPTEAIFVLIPVLVFAIVFGLSMDYEVFLLARVKEAFDRTGRNDLAVPEGLSASASTITSAALIMIFVFGAFAFARVFVVQVLGFGLAMAVLLDATIIRMVIVPALMRLAGEWNWWPGGRR